MIKERRKVKPSSTGTAMMIHVIKFGHQGFFFFSLVKNARIISSREELSKICNRKKLARIRKIQGTPRSRTREGRSNT